MMFEQWHGCELPPIVLPKVFVTELIKIKKKPTHLGCSEKSVTIYFEDKSWIRTQVYVERYADVDRVLNINAAPWPIPAGLWEALGKIAGLDGEPHVFFGANHVRTDAALNHGAICEIDGTLPPDLQYNLELLRMFEPYAKQVDWLADDGRMAVFYGDNFRGMLSSIRVYKPDPSKSAMDDEIPF
jgi:hypothetical protein